MAGEKEFDADLKVEDKVWIIPLLDPETREIVGYGFQKRNGYNGPVDINDEVEK